MMRHFNKPEMKETRRYLRRKQTYCEKLIWMYLRNRRFLGCKFRRQYSADSFAIDFYCPELKLALEIDGEIHEVEEQMFKDKTRQEYLESYGIHFLRIRMMHFWNIRIGSLRGLKMRLKSFPDLTPNPSP